MQLFYEFGSNAERDRAIADAQFEMTQAKYERDMAVIEANYKYNQKLAEYKCLVENGTYDDYAHMIFLATEEADEQKNEAKKNIFEIIKDFFVRIIKSFQYIFTGKIDGNEKAPAPDPKGVEKAHTILDTVKTSWNTFISKVTGNNEPMSDNDFDKIFQAVSAIAGVSVAKAGTDMAVDKIKETVKPISDRVAQLQKDMGNWIIGYQTEIENKKEKGEPIGMRDKVLTQALKIFNAVKHPIETVADLFSKAVDWFKEKTKKKDGNDESTDDKNTNSEGSTDTEKTDSEGSGEKENTGDKPADTESSPSKRVQRAAKRNGGKHLEPDAKYKTNGLEFDKAGWEKEEKDSRAAYEAANVENPSNDQVKARDAAAKRHQYAIAALLNYGVDIKEALSDKKTAKNNKKANKQPKQKGTETNTTGSAQATEQQASGDGSKNTTGDGQTTQQQPSEDTSKNKPNEGNASAWDDDFDVDAMFAEFGL